jgi:integrase
VTFKTFRKTVATRITRQLDSKAAARQLGHASDTITETYYIPRSETGPQVAALLDEVLRSSDPTA